MGMMLKKIFIFNLFLVFVFYLVSCHDGNEGRYYPPFHWAARIGNIEEVKSLLAEGVDVNAERYQKQTALHLASLHGHKEVVLFLISKGANVNAKSKTKLRPLHFTNKVEIAKILLDNGAVLSARANNNWTALNSAISKENTKLALFLIDKGIEVNNKGYKRGVTPLTVASIDGQTKVVEALLKKGADPSVKRKDGHTALSLAKMFEHQAVVVLLESATKNKPIAD